MPIDISNRDDLRRVYLYIFDAFAADISEIAKAHKGINTRYARQLVAALQQGNLVTLTEDGEGNEAWQSIQTTDDLTHEEAEAKFDEWAGVAAPQTPSSATAPRKSAGKAASKDPHECLCGCGEVITTRSLYRPGHDARHAGQVGREIASIMNGGHDEGDQITIDSLIEALPTDALRRKAMRVADNANRKNLAKAKPDPVAVEGIMRVGKNEVPGRLWTDGLAEYLDPKTSEWKPASKTATKTFQEG